MATEKVRGKVARKAGNGKGFMIEGDSGWFNTSAAATPYLAAIQVGTDVDIEYFTKGVKREVTKISAVVAAAPVKREEPKPEPQKAATPKYACKTCGKELKDDKYETCYACNKKNPHQDTGTASSGGSRYGSAEDVAGKEVGCAAGCAASILAGRQEQPEDLLEMFRCLTNGILEHIRALK